MILRRPVLLLASLAFWAAGSGCGGDGGRNPVQPRPTPVTVSVAPDAASLEAGATMPLSARVTGTPDARVRWSSDDAALAAVDSTGRVTGKGVGVATITATSLADPSARGTARITVVGAAVAAVRVSPPTATLPAGQTVQLSATVLDARDAQLAGRQVAWSSADPAIAEVSGTGLVSARSAGTVRITASSEGVSGSAEVTVSEPPPPPPSPSALGFSFSGDRSGTYSVTGEVPLDASRRPQYGTWAAALPQDTVNLQVAAARAGTGRLADVFLIVLHRVSAPGTYTLSASCTESTPTSCARGLLAFGYNWDSRNPPPEAQYDLAAGTITVTSVSADRVRGTFEVSGPRVSTAGGATISLTSGSFDVAVVPNTLPLARNLLPLGFPRLRR